MKKGDGQGQGKRFVIVLHLEVRLYTNYIITCSKEETIGPFQYTINRFCRACETKTPYSHHRFASARTEVLKAFEGQAKGQ